MTVPSPRTGILDVTESSTGISIVVGRGVGTTVTAVVVTTVVEVPTAVGELVTDIPPCFTTSCAVVVSGLIYPPWSSSVLRLSAI